MTHGAPGWPHPAPQKTHPNSRQPSGIQSQTLLCSLDLQDPFLGEGNKLHRRARGIPITPSSSWCEEQPHQRPLLWGCLQLNLLSTASWRRVHNMSGGALPVTRGSWTRCGLGRLGKQAGSSQFSSAGMGGITSPPHVPPQGFIQQHGYLVWPPHPPSHCQSSPCGVSQSQ